MRVARSWLLLILLLPAPGAWAVKIQGTVTRAVTGATLPNLPVQVMRISTNTGSLVTYTAASTVTDGAGKYVTPIDLPLGNYWLRVNNKTTGTNGLATPTGYEGLYYHPGGNRPNRDPLTPIVITATTVLADIHFVLRPAFAITGTVSAAGVSDYSLVDFDAYDAVTGDSFALIDANATTAGTYTIYGFPAGSYHLRCDPDPSMGLYPVFQGNHFLDSDTAPIVISNSLARTNFILAIGARISGLVLDDVNPVVDTDIDIYLVRSNKFIFVTDSARSITPGGFYTTGLLMPGNYIVRADPAALSYYYLNYYTTNGASAPLAELASTVTLGLIDSVNTDIPVFSGGMISGAVKYLGAGVTNISIDVYRTDRKRMEVVTTSTTNGAYLVGALPPGQYIVRADPAPAQGFIRTYFTNNHFIEEGTPVTVTAGLVTSNINFSLARGAFMAGRLVDTNGSGLTGIDLDIFDASGRFMEGGAVSTTGGLFLAGPYPSGSYTFRADPSARQFLCRTYYTGSLDVAFAQPVTLSAPATNTLSNMVLRTAGVISGWIRDTNGVTALPGIDLDVYDAITGTRADASGASAADGSYELGPIPPGSYIIRADPTVFQQRAMQYWKTVAIDTLASNISVSAGSVVSNINFPLLPAGSIAGFVFNASGSNPVAGIDMDIYDEGGVRASVNAITGSNGFYLAGPLLPGNYVIRADPDAGQFWVREYYPEVNAIALAAPVAVQALQVVSNVSFTLEPGATISGRITDLSTSALASVDLDVFPVGGGTLIEQTALSDSNGNYAVGPVPLGSWTIRANPSALSGLETRYYISTGSISNAMPVVVGMTQHVNGINFALGSNAVPVASLAQFAGISTGGIFTLNAAASTDANNDRLLYRWRQVSGPPVLFDNTNAASPVITLPEGVATGTVFAFEVVSRDFTSESAPKVVYVNPGPPVIRNLVRSGGAFDMEWTLGSYAQPYLIESTSNLVDWITGYTGTETSIRTNTVISTLHLRVRIP